MNANWLPVLLGANKYRLLDYDLPTIFGMHSGPLIALGLIILSFAIGIAFANAARMRDYGWKIGLILSTVLVSLFVVLFGDFKLGVDLKGGVILVYEVNERETDALRRSAQRKDWDMGQLTRVISDRLNPTGLSEIIVRPFGPKQVEIVVPEVDPDEVKRIEELVETAGVLQFMIVASDEKDTELAEAARAQSERGSEYRWRRDVSDADGNQVGYWASFVRENQQNPNSPFRALETIENGYLRDASTGMILELLPSEKRSFAQNPPAFEAYLKERAIKNLDVLMVFDPDFSIRGDDLAFSYAGYDEAFRPAIHFTMDTDGSIKMGHVTQENLRRKLAIIFDNRLLSAPVIQSKITDQGQITGNFTQEEVDFIVGILDTGSMPVVMQKQPISKNQIGAILGLDTIKKGSWSVVISLSLVLVFMVIYYQYSGLVASFALALNLLMTVGIMVLLKAPFTLPGLAGLVLTVAMSVDANVLISERMREELARGATLRMAIRNGFDKALSAIIDGNLTTLLTALVLYFIGTDQVKGFGMTLMLGNITSMFTAIFCARVILDVSEKTRLIKTLSMFSILSRPSIDWVRYFNPGMVASLVLIMIGIVATVARGKGLFDTDLAGGTSVSFILKEPLPEATVREKLATAFKDLKDPETSTTVDHNVYELAMENRPAGSAYKVDSSLQDIDLLKETVREALKAPGGQDALKTFSMEIGRVEEVPVEPPASGPSISAPGTRAPPAEAPAAPAEKSNVPPAEKKAPAEEPKANESQPKTGDANEEKPSSGCGADEEQEQDQEQKQEKAQPAESDAKAKADTPVAAPATAIPETPATSEPTVQAAFPAATPPAAPLLATVTKAKSKVVIRFPGSPIGATALVDRLNVSAKEVIGQELDIVADNADWDHVDNATFDEWTVTLPVDAEAAGRIVQHAKNKLENEVDWQTSSKIGGQVSADTRWRALGALGVSLLGIIAYVWFRFQNVAWGLAAVAALAHDALVMLTGIAASYWLAGPLGFLGVEEFKISLPVVAAFLAILGYSVNDTIVIFDRLREIRGKSPRVTREMLNAAVNETLGRTIVLAGITLTTVVILYAFGGPGIHAFSFAMVIGVISGCYSTLVIAAPTVLWLLNRQPSYGTAAGETSKPGVTKSVA
jgi:SecD/SecF fusion protein